MTYEYKGQEKAYWNHEIANLLEISDSTLRKWCIQLESNGYVFIKGDRDTRAFTMHDVVALKFFKKLVKTERKTKEMASYEVIKRYGERHVTPPMQSLETQSEVVHLQERFEEMMNMLEGIKTQLHDQMEFNKKLVERMDQQNINHVREMQEAKTQIAVAQQRNKWWKFW